LKVCQPEGWRDLAAEAAIHKRPERPRRDAMTGVNFDQLRTMSAKLNKASDALSAQIAQLESILNGLKMWVTMSRYTEESDGHYLTNVEMLGYAKHKGKWGLLYSEECEQFPENEYVVPLRDAPRLERIAAVDKIPDLVKQLESNAAEVIAIASTKAAQLSGLVADLRPTSK
jgi:hypothetical protein